jgi:FkbM family methyltransferase
MDGLVELADTTSIAGALDDLLSESALSAAKRARWAFDEQVHPFDRKLVLFGAGGLGRRTLAGLRQHSIEPFAFADNNPDLWGREQDGLLVLSPQEAASRFASRAAFVVTIWHAGGQHRFKHTQQQLLDLGCSRVVSFASLYWKYPGTFLPYYALDLPEHVLRKRDEVRRAFSLWTDGASQHEYLAQVRWRLWLDFDGLASPVAHEQYFPEDLFRWLPNEVLVDCGAYDGDSLKSFLRRRGENFKEVVTLEPDPTNFAKLTDFVLEQNERVRNKITLSRLAVAGRRGKLYFDATGTAAATLSAGGALEVDCAPLDEILADRCPTFLKMDIEGAEPDALAGAQEIIRRVAPVLALCVYHQQDHLWRIPLVVRSLSDQYRFFLRPHNEECWDLICYAVPKARLLTIEA